MAWTSTVPGTIDALVALWQLALDEVWVSDGPAVGNEAAMQFVEVGHSDNNDEAVRTETSPEGLGGDRNRETYSIYCSATAMDGSNDQSTVRLSAFNLYQACIEAVAADPTLTGAVLRALPGEFTVRQYATNQGIACNITFAVSVTAFSL